MVCIKALSGTLSPTPWCIECFPGPLGLAAFFICHFCAPSTCCWEVQQCCTGAREPWQAGLSQPTLYLMVTFRLNKNWMLCNHPYCTSTSLAICATKNSLVKLQAWHVCWTGTRSCICVCLFLLLFFKHLTTKTSKPFGHLDWITFNQLMWANVSTRSHSEMLAVKPGMLCHRDEQLNEVMINYIHSAYSDSGFSPWRQKRLPFCSLFFFFFEF